MLFLWVGLTLGLRPGIDLYDVYEQRKVCHWKYHDVDTEELVLNGKKEKQIEFQLTGECPHLKRIVITTLFGYLHGKLEGEFPLLERIEIQAGKSSIELDLQGNIAQTCKVSIEGGEGQHKLSFPQDRHVKIQTKSSSLHVTQKDFIASGWWNKQFLRRKDLSSGWEVSLYKMKGSVELV